MSVLKQKIFRAGMDALYVTNAHKVLQQFVGGAGAILMLHHVRPAHPRAFAPNALLEITPDFLEQVILRVRSSGFEIIGMDEVHARLKAGEQGKPFVTFTFDDGYRDNLEFAYSILKRHSVPFTMYLPTAFMDGDGEPWWLVLEHVIRSQEVVTASIDGQMVEFSCRTPAEKARCFDKLYWWMRSLPGEDLYRYMEFTARRNGVDYKSFNRSLCHELYLSWDELRDLGRDPLVTFGAHTVEHIMLAKFDYGRCLRELIESRRRISTELDRAVDHFCFPVGDASSAGTREFELAQKLGFKTAVTTRPGVVFPEHRDFLTALPRVSLNGHYQSLRYLDVLLSGAALALFNRFKRVNAA